LAAVRLAAALTLALAAAVLHSVILNIPGGHMILKGAVSAVVDSGTACGVKLYPGQRLTVKLWTQCGYVEAADNTLVVRDAEGEVLVDGRLVCRGLVNIDARIKPGTVRANLVLTARFSAKALVTVDANPLEQRGEVLVAGITPPFMIDLDAGRASLYAKTVALNPLHLSMVSSEGMLLAAVLAASIPAAILLTRGKRSTRGHKAGVI